VESEREEIRKIGLSLARSMRALAVCYGAKATEEAATIAESTLAAGA